jgi:Four helix bundle sensory module for signal transduction
VRGRTQPSPCGIEGQHAEKFEAEQRMAGRPADLDRAGKAFAQLAGGTEERALFETLQADWKAYLAMRRQLTTLSRINEGDAARALMFGESRKLYSQSAAAPSRGIELNKHGVIAEGRNSEDNCASATGPA